jgi:hypothetical protein
VERLRKELAESKARVAELQVDVPSLRTRLAASEARVAELEQVERNRASWRANSALLNGRPLSAPAPAP